MKLARNFGEHNAVMEGLHHARSDYIVTMDDDLQNQPSEVLKLLDHARSGGYEVVYSYYAPAVRRAGRGEECRRRERAVG